MIYINDTFTIKQFSFECHSYNKYYILIFEISADSLKINTADANVYETIRLLCFLLFIHALNMVYN